MMTWLGVPTSQPNDSKKKRSLLWYLTLPVLTAFASIVLQRTPGFGSGVCFVCFVVVLGWFGEGGWVWLFLGRFAVRNKKLFMNHPEYLNHIMEYYSRRYIMYHPEEVIKVSSLWIMDAWEKSRLFATKKIHLKRPQSNKPAKHSQRCRGGSENLRQTAWKGMCLYWNNGNHYWKLMVCIRLTSGDFSLPP